jgi:hypothetical protein
MCLVAIALVHLLDVKDKFEEVPYLGVLFIGLIVTSLVLAEALIRADEPLIWVGAGLMAAATILGYVLSRSVGLPGEGGGEIGNWWEGLGLASLLVEGVVVWLAVVRLTPMRAPARATA